ncbi:hypothetical protein [Sulfitobacter guttiformis]|uniref:Uncharacterized protein n=1 Tax=Sulfitobacter guttiformis TaxID=74349 RepID=A0A420DKF9_9RHOB|nr:hypothetical protein [Sulfitobacter guttiformis]RKE94647.1 hypothetical protein C8N30_3778 [Sulfitobacter guttiformis]
MLTRRLVAALTLAVLAGMLALDLRMSQPLDPFRTPAVLALGSGQAGAGAHCAALPTSN